MLRKTAAIAVLILIVSSFTLGSTGRVQTVTSGGSEGMAPEQFTHERGPAGFPHAAGFTDAGHVQMVTGGASEGYVQDMPVPEDAFPLLAGFVSAGIVQMLPGSEDAVTTVAGIAGAGSGQKVIRTQTMAGTADEGDIPQASGENYSTMEFYIDNIQIEQPAFHGMAFLAPVGETAAGTAYVLPFPMPAPAHGNMTLIGRVAMLTPGDEPEFHDFRWDRVHAGGLAENDSFAVFSGHMMIPDRNGSFEYASPFDFITGMASGGAIEINSSMVVDLANLSAAMSTTANASLADDQYNNQISAGQTNWHSASVSSAVKSVNIDLKWRNQDDKLRLMIYTPDGKVLGPYYDDSDGKEDGRINLNIANPSGVAAGEWHLKVTDMATLGNDDYYVRTY